jgi:hypothetical protein
VGSNPTGNMDVCVCLFCVHIVSGETVDLRKG